MPTAVAARAGTNTLARTTSTSQQFIAYSDEPLLSSALCLAAERVKRSWLDALGIQDRGRDPILLILRDRTADERDAPAMTADIFQTDTHLKYQITFLTPPPIAEGVLLTALVDALCAEAVNRDQPVFKSKPFKPAPVPRWLVHGFTQSFLGHTDLLIAVARRSMNAGRPTSAGDLLGAQRAPADPLERELYDANAWLFTESLLDLPSGGAQLHRFINELGTLKSSSNAFWSVYGATFPDDAALERWWSVQREHRVVGQVAQALSVEETCRQIDGILQTKLKLPAVRGHVQTETEVGLDRLGQYYEKKWLKELLKDKLHRLEALRGQAHPSYRAVIGDYVVALRNLVDEKLNRFQRAMKAAVAARTTTDRNCREITDYLDRAEHRYAPDDSAVLFQHYFRIFDQLQSLDEQRHNPISDYLDKFDK